MLTIPTDSLNKFLAIGSIVLMVFVMDVCLKNYEKAELAYISAFVKASEFQRDYKKYAAHINKSIEIYKNYEKNKNSISDVDKKKILEETNKASAMNPQMDKSSMELLDLSYKSRLYQRLKYIWIFITLISFIVCSFSAYIGFKGWYLFEKNNNQ
ncbi:hypothetical protein [Acinetobacter sp. UC24323]|uniref:hypothetical protein n=1 Tax=Acinetobacter sp. UC24323 TaxID=2839946 RepID=UPI00209F1B5E|nr:hypothetical protein [Acinetobacter sp. UC24323]MCO9051442.1 hypothetical protein [Acinetobacter sp. UC24323]MDC4464855.1 hypothetical protein [Acinetobacter baumannii]